MKLVHPQTGKLLVGLKPSQVHKVGSRAGAWLAFEPSEKYLFGTENPNGGQVVSDLQSARIVGPAFKWAVGTNRQHSEKAIDDATSGLRTRQLSDLKGLISLSMPNVVHRFKIVNVPHEAGPVPVVKVYSYIHVSPRDAQNARDSKPTTGLLNRKLKAWHSEIVEALEKAAITEKPKA